MTCYGSRKINVRVSIKRNLQERGNEVIHVAHGARYRM